MNPSIHNLSTQLDKPTPEPRTVAVTVTRKTCVPGGYLLPGKTYIVPRAIERALRVAGTLASSGPVPAPQTDKSAAQQTQAKGDKANLK